MNTHNVKNLSQLRKDLGEELFGKLQQELEALRASGVQDPIELNPIIKRLRDEANG